MNRRNFLRIGVAAVIAAPALVSRSSIMTIKPARPDPWPDGERWERWEWIGKLLRMEIGEIDRFTIYVDHALPGSDKAVIARWNDGAFDVVDLSASNYGRGPGLLSEDGAGVRRWSPLDPPAQTAREIEAKQRQAQRTIRAILEPHRSKRWV